MVKSAPISVRYLTGFLIAMRFSQWRQGMVDEPSVYLHLTRLGATILFQQTGTPPHLVYMAEPATAKIYSY